MYKVKKSTGKHTFAWEMYSKSFLVGNKTNYLVLADINEMIIIRMFLNKFMVDKYNTILFSTIDTGCLLTEDLHSICPCQVNSANASL